MRKQFIALSFLTLFHAAAAHAGVHGQAFEIVVKSTDCEAGELEALDGGEEVKLNVDPNECREMVKTHQNGLQCNGVRTTVQYNSYDSLGGLITYDEIAGFLYAEDLPGPCGEPIEDKILDFLLGS